MEKKECKFCKMIKQNEVLFENEHIAVVLGRPHHRGHLVVLTKNHVEGLLNLNQQDLNSFLNDTIKIMKVLKKVIKFHHFNLSYFDNWDPHIHWNVYPRYRTDPDWGNPPYIPHLDEEYIPHELSEKEKKQFRKELEKLKMEDSE